MAKIDPEPGHWYEDMQEGQIFRVTRVDTDAETIEVRHLDGTVEEMDLGSWRELELEEIEEPEVEDDDFDDLDMDEEDSLDPEEWGGSLEDIETED